MSEFASYTERNLACFLVHCRQSVDGPSTLSKADMSGRREATNNMSGAIDKNIKNFNPAGVITHLQIKKGKNHWEGRIKWTIYVSADTAGNS